MSDETRPGILSNTLAIVGLFIVLIILIWGLLHLASLLSPWFSSFFASKATPGLEVKAPTSVTSGESFAVQWTYQPSVPGSYAFLYACNDSLHFSTAGTGGTLNTIPCGTAFSVSGTSVTLTPNLSGSQTISEPLSIIFVPTQAGAQTQGSATVKVIPGAEKPVVTVTKPVAPSGVADLSVQILSATVDANGWATVIFDISNIGTGNSGSYSFQAYLPTRSTYTYYSPAQTSLAPGSHIVNTLRFTQAVPGSLSVIVDPSNVVTDSNRTNNYATQTLSMPYGYNPQTYYTNQPQPTYYGQTYVY